MNNQTSFINDADLDLVSGGDIIGHPLAGNPGYSYCMTGGGMHTAPTYNCDGAPTIGNWITSTIAANAATIKGAGK